MSGFWEKTECPIFLNTHLFYTHLKKPKGTLYPVKQGIFMWHKQTEHFLPKDTLYLIKQGCFHVIQANGISLDLPEQTYSTIYSSYLLKEQIMSKNETQKSSGKNSVKGNLDLYIFTGLILLLLTLRVSSIILGWMGK